MPFAARWVDLEIIILSEVSQSWSGSLGLVNANFYIYIVYKQGPIL